jgi:site-specific recombinase XerD
MTKAAPKDKLTIYRRHAAKKCDITNPKDLTSCDCPLWVHGKLRGEFIRESLDTRKLPEGLQKVERRLAGAPEPPTPGTGPKLVGTPAPDGEISLAFAADEFMKSKGKKASRTKVIYASAVNSFVGWTEQMGLVLLKEVDTPQIREYLLRYESEWKISTLQNRLMHLRVWFNYCRMRRWITHTPTADRDLNYGKGRKASRVPFTPQEVTKILAAVEQLPEASRDRARALVLLLLYSGMRISDATFVERSYLNERDVLDYYVIKTRRPISLPPTLQKPAADALNALPASRVYFFQPDREDDYQEVRQGLRDGEEFVTLMPDYEARVRETTMLVLKVLALAGLSGACHRFRDTFAINMLSAGADIFTVSQMLGHSDVKITQDHYLKLIPGYRERMSQSTRVLAYQFPLAG